MRTVALPCCFSYWCVLPVPIYNRHHNQDACGGKANQACYNIPAVNQKPSLGSSRSITGRLQHFPLQYNFILVSTEPTDITERIQDFVANRMEPRTISTVVATFESMTAHSQEHFSSMLTMFRFVRDGVCGGTLGWHYRILAEAPRRSNSHQTGNP